MEPLKVTFEFSSPLVLDSEYAVHLDALVAWCVVDEAESMGAPNAWAFGDDLAHIFGRAAAPGGDWVWQASQLRFEAAKERFFLNMVRRSDPLLYMSAFDRGLLSGRSRSSISGGSGQERGYQWLQPYQWMARAEAWCIADRDALEDALTRLQGVGRMKRNGFGRIHSLSIETDASAADRWRVRALPSGMQGAAGVDYVPCSACIRAPYWKKTGRVSAVEPIVL